MMDVGQLAGLTEAVNAEFAQALQVTGPDAEGTFADWHELSSVVAALATATRVKVIGISGSQGSGKSTLARVLADTLNQQCADLEQAATCSIDDFYLSKDARAALARDIHPLLQTRGVPGTHEWQLLGDVLASVQAGERFLELPRFDKGRDDRARPVTCETDMLILEGWCLGVSAQPDSLLASPVNALEAAEDADGVWRTWVNEQIALHYEPLWSQVDLWIHLRVPGFDQVLEWRGQQEQQLHEDQRMSSAQITRFIAHYERLTRWMWQQSAWGPGFVVQLDAHHEIAGVTVKNAKLI